jgi:hypothetical protein
MVKHLLILLFLFFPVLNNLGSGTPVRSVETQADLYTKLNLSSQGLSCQVFELAMKGHQKLADEQKLRNSDILTIVDFSQSSKNKRMYVIDLVHQTLLFNTYVAHGRNTGDEFAKHFSNVSGSFQSSLGFYVTKAKITGSHVGVSLILDGMEKGFNDNALQRQIIVHGAEYATEKFIQKAGRLGRSYGCPSLPPDMIKPVIETIKEGSCLFIYCQDDDYMRRSKLLN